MNLYDIYFRDLNVPIAYLILTIGVFLICKKRKIPIILTFFIWVFSGFGLAFLFDAVYDIYMTGNLIFLLFPFTTYVFMLLIYKFGEFLRLIFLIIPIVEEIVLINLSITYNIQVSAILRYNYVFYFLIIIHSLRQYKKIEKN